MLRREIALMLLVALPCRAATDVDAGELPPAVWAERAQLQLVPDGGWVDSECFPIGDGGTACSGGWLPDPRLEAHGGEVARLRAENARLVATPPLFSTSTWVVMAFEVGLALFLGGYLGYALRGFIDGH